MPSTHLLSYPLRTFAYKSPFASTHSDLGGHDSFDNVGVEYLQRMDAEDLHKLQKQYEQNENGYPAALAYFKELNRQGKYQTVIRLFDDREDDFRTSPMAKEITQQYDYAFENVEYLRRSLTELSNANRGSAFYTGFGKSSQAFSAFREEFFMKLFKSTVMAVLVYVMLTYGMKAMRGMGENDAGFDFKQATDVEQRLDDVKGIDEIRHEVDNIIRVIRDPSKYMQKGAKLFKGLLLFGEPGTGKTLLARAIAGEAGCNFIYCTGSDFDEMYVGVGAKRVRKLFKEARKNTPCIIFIDEIDSLLSGSRRGGGEHSSMRGTLT
jgi:ATP-dependent metalloprotease